MDILEIEKILPHRFPFLFVDRIIELEEGKRAVGIKNITINEPFFQGHFPGEPVMPAILMVEAMAQVGAVVLLKMPEHKGKVAYFTGIDKARFRKQVGPGDRLRIETEMIRIRSSMGKGHGRVLVEEKLVAEADLMYALGEAQNGEYKPAGD